ncbi:replication protein A 70 kDa DNA-binding subunit B [Tanacetum coccineum]
MFRFEPLFQEGQCYSISNFAIAENSGRLPMLPHKYKISFYKGTVVTRIDAFDNYVNGFILEPFNRLLDGTLQYHEHEAVVVAIGDIVPVQSAAGRKIRREVVIEDSESNQLDCTFWDHWANMWDKYAIKRDELGHVIFILWLGKVKYWDGTPSIHNALFGTKMFINRDLPEILSFRQRLKELPEYDESQFKISLFTPQKSVVTIAEFFHGAVKKMVLSIRECEQWAYTACKECNKKVNVVESKATSSAGKSKVTFYCEDHGVVQVASRLKSSEFSITALMQDSNTDGLAAIISKLDNLGRDMKKLKVNVHAIQVGCQIYDGPIPSTKNVILNADNCFVILEIIEDFRMPIILGRPLLATAHAKVDIFRKTISLEVGNEKEEFKKYGPLVAPLRKSVTGVAYAIMEIKCYWESKNDDKRIDVEWENLSLNDWLRIRFEEVSETARDKILRDHWRKRFGNEYDDNGDFEDLDGCGEGTHEDDDDLEGIIDYLEPTLYDGFIDSDYEEYKERNIGPGELYTKIKVSEVEDLSRTRGNIATIRAGVMEEIFENDDEKSHR